MKIKLLLSILLYATSLGFAQTHTKAHRSYLGVMLDSQPIPGWLAPQLGLQPGQGLRVANLQKNGPADKAGLQQNDVIIELNGYPILNPEKFINAIANTGIGSRVTLTILRHGQRKTIKVTLGAKAAQFQPKYPPEVQEVHSQRPRNVYRIDPNQNQLQRITPPRSSRGIGSEIHSYRFQNGGVPMTVTVVGDPHKAQAFIMIQQGHTSIQTNVKDINTLPQSMRRYAQQALEKAQRTQPQAHQESPPLQAKQSQPQHESAEEHLAKNWEQYSSKMLEDIKNYAKQLDESAGKPRLMLQEHRQRLDRLEKQVQDILKRLDVLEKAQKKPRAGEQQKAETTKAETPK